MYSFSAQWTFTLTYFNRIPNYFSYVIFNYDGILLLVGVGGYCTYPRLALILNLFKTVLISYTLAYSSDSSGQYKNIDVLLRALVEAEIDGVAVANQLTALKDTIDSFTKVSLAPNDNFGSGG